MTVDRLAGSVIRFYLLVVGPSSNSSSRLWIIAVVVLAPTTRWLATSIIAQYCEYLSMCFICGSLDPHVTRVNITRYLPSDIYEGN